MTFADFEESVRNGDYDDICTHYRYKHYFYGTFSKICSTSKELQKIYPHIGKQLPCSFICSKTIDSSSEQHYCAEFRYPNLKFFIIIWYRVSDGDISATTFGDDDLKKVNDAYAFELS